MLRNMYLTEPCLKALLLPQGLHRTSPLPTAWASASLLASGTTPSAWSPEPSSSNARTGRTSLWVRRTYLRHINSKRSPSRLPFFCLWCISVILQHYINEEKEAYGFPENCVFLQSGNGGTIRRGPKGLRKGRTG